MVFMYSPGLMIPLKLQTKDRDDVDNAREAEAEADDDGAETELCLYSHTYEHALHFSVQAAYKCRLTVF